MGPNDKPPLGPVAWVAVPGIEKLDLRRIGANPGGTPLSFQLSIPHAGPASLDLLDVAGRVIEQRRWDAIPAGRTLVTLGNNAQSSGCYFARLTVPGAKVIRSVIVLR